MKSKKNKKINIVSLDSITQLQKIALEGEIAKALSTARHDEEILYRYYTILKRAPQEISYLLVQIVRDMIDVKQGLLDQVTLEASLDITPLWIWVDRTIADLKLSLKLACSDPIGSASMDRKELQKKLIKSAFVYYVRSIAMISPTAASTLCRYLVDEQPIELDFLEDACFALLAEISELLEDETTMAELEPEGKISEDIIHTTFDINKILSYKVETDVVEQITKNEKKVERKRNADKKEVKAKVNIIPDKQLDLSAMLQKTIAEILDAQHEDQKKETGKYIVVKEYAGCDVSTPLRECKSEEEAEKFIESMKKQFPELVKTVTFRICKG